MPDASSQHNDRHLLESRIEQLFTLVRETKLSYHAIKLVLTTDSLAAEHMRSAGLSVLWAQLDALETGLDALRTDSTGDAYHPAR